MGRLIGDQHRESMAVETASSDVSPNRHPVYAWFLGVLLGVAPLLYLDALADASISAKFLCLTLALTVSFVVLAVRSALRNETHAALPWVSLPGLLCVVVLIANGATAHVGYFWWHHLLHLLVALVLLLWLASGAVPLNSLPLLIRFTSAGAALAALIGCFQVWFGIDWFYQARIPASTFTNPNFAAHYLAIVFPLTLGLFVHETGRVQRVLLGLAMLGMLTFLSYALTRTAYLQVGLTTLVLLLVGVVVLRDHLRARLDRLALVILGVVVVLTLVMSQFEGELLERLREEKTSGMAAAMQAADVREDTSKATKSFRHRLALWQSAVDVWKQQPLTGVGLDNYRHAALPVINQYVDHLKVTLVESRVHNDYLQLLAETGIIGLAAFTGLLISLGWAFVGAWQAAQPHTRWLLAVLLAGLLSLAVAAVFSFPLYRPMPLLIGAILAGLLAASALRSTWVLPAKLSPFVRFGLPISLLLLAVVATHSVVQQTRSDAAEKRMIDGLAEGRFDDVVSVGSLAYARDPNNANVSSMLAAAYAYRQEPERAREILEATRERYPLLQPNNYLLGSVLLTLEAYTEAQPVFEDVLTVIPDHPGALFNLAQLDRIQGERALAFEKFLRLIDLYGPKADVLQAAIRTVYHLDDKAAALADLNRLAKAAPDKGLPHIALGDFYRNRLRDQQGAMAHYKAALQAENTLENQRMIAQSLRVKRLPAMLNPDG